MNNFEAEMKALVNDSQPEFAGYIAILKDCDGSGCGTVDMSRRKMLHDGLTDIPVTPLDACQEALDSFEDPYSFPYHFNQGDCVVMIVNITTGEVDQYDNQRMFDEIERNDN